MKPRGQRTQLALVNQSVLDEDIAPQAAVNVDVFQELDQGPIAELRRRGAQGRRERAMEAVRLELSASGKENPALTSGHARR
jgi:hypothetical protein